MPVTTAAQLKYEQSEHRKALRVKYEQSEKGKAYRKAWSRTPRGRYAQHSSRASGRGIAFLITFDEWWGVWEEHWWNRGPKGDSYCMGRYDDTGAYELGNVYICTMAENSSKARSRKEGLCQNAA